MFQFDAGRPKKRATDLSKIAIAATPAPPISGRTLLAWGEHCVECAAPACYTSCDLYQASPTLDCRRFEDGIVANRSLPGGDVSAEVRFKRWGKLEAQGNATLFGETKVAWAERILTLASPFGGAMGRAVGRLTGQRRWYAAMQTLHKRINERLQAAGAKAQLPNAFIAEIINPGQAPARLTLTATVDKLRLARAVSAEQLPRPMAIPIVAPPGFSRQVLPVAGMGEILSSGLPFNLALTPAEGDDLHLIFKRLDLVALAATDAEATQTGPRSSDKPAKLVIFDLDNTLWDGILLEGKVNLRPGIAELFRRLDERGVLISVASKNAYDDAWAELTAAGLAEYILHPRIGWGAKSEAVAAIIKAIDIGADTVMFIDDNPFERAEVAAAVAGVQVLPDTVIGSLADHARLQGAVTAESRGRRQMYREAIVREEIAEGFGDDYLAFLRDCDIHVEIRPDRAEDFERVVELVQRTNQLNFSGRKYSREEIGGLLGQPNLGRVVVTCRDKFGSYGTVGFGLWRREPLPEGGEAVVVDDLMLSCRVQGKFIEQAVFWRLSQQTGAAAVIVNFRPTEKNRAAEMVLDKLGFQTGPDGRRRRDLTADDLAVDFLTIEG